MKNSPTSSKNWTNIQEALESFSTQENTTKVVNPKTTYNDMPELQELLIELMENGRTPEEALDQLLMMVKMGVDND